ncbi:helix-turn-helix transcriptional regulator [Streptomyces sp. 039-1]|uniref:helix-turn-helix transcriptional regulator n=1 Tax=Streptomyces sp. 039-1 TaxID=2789263 RepID=UPI0039F524C8
MEGMVTKDEVGLGTTIRAWRERLAPSAPTSPTGRPRRAAGLRREELAERAGVSVDYVVRLEQGRATAPSAQVVASLARALELSPTARDHLHRMAGLAAPNDAPIPDDIPAGVRRVLNRLGEVAVAVFAADWQMIWWNRGWAALLGDPADSPAELRNFARERFPVSSDRVSIAWWPVSVDNQDASDLTIVSDLRRATARFPHDVRLAELIRVLVAGNPTFARLWASGTVAAHREEHKTIEHPGVGPVEVDCDVLTDGESELKIVILTTAPGSADEARFRRALGMASDATATPDGPVTARTTS